MLSLIAACTVFVGIHIFVSGSPLRGRLVGVIGERAYQGAFSIASLGSLVWMAMAYNGADYVPLWTAPVGLRHLVALLMLIVGSVIESRRRKAASPVDNLNRAKGTGDPENRSAAKSPASATSTPR